MSNIEFAGDDSWVRFRHPLYGRVHTLPLVMIGTVLGLMAAAASGQSRLGLMLLVGAGVAISVANGVFINRTWAEVNEIDLTVSRIRGARTVSRSKIVLLEEKGRSCIAILADNDRLEFPVLVPPESLGPLLGFDVRVDRTWRPLD